eukprot:Lankesteria_metandrocarpae@DN2010_c0_g1_i1.p1
MLNVRLESLDNSRPKKRSENSKASRRKRKDTNGTNIAATAGTRDHYDHHYANGCTPYPLLVAGGVGSRNNTRMNNISKQTTTMPATHAVAPIGSFNSSCLTNDSSSGSGRNVAFSRYGCQNSPDTAIEKQPHQLLSLTRGGVHEASTSASWDGASADDLSSGVMTAAAAVWRASPDSHLADVVRTMYNSNSRTQETHEPSSELSRNGDVCRSRVSRSPHSHSLQSERGAGGRRNGCVGPQMDLINTVLGSRVSTVTGNDNSSSCNDSNNMNDIYCTTGTSHLPSDVQGFHSRCSRAYGHYADDAEDYEAATDDYGGGVLQRRKQPSPQQNYDSADLSLHDAAAAVPIQQSHSLYEYNNNRGSTSHKITNRSRKNTNSPAANGGVYDICGDNQYIHQIVPQQLHGRYMSNGATTESKSTYQKRGSNTAVVVPTLMLNRMQTSQQQHLSNNTNDSLHYSDSYRLHDAQQNTFPGSAGGKGSHRSLQATRQTVNSSRTPREGSPPLHGGQQSHRHHQLIDSGFGSPAPYSSRSSVYDYHHQHHRRTHRPLQFSPPGSKSIAPFKASSGAHAVNEQQPFVLSPALDHQHPHTHLLHNHHYPNYQQHGHLNHLHHQHLHEHQFVDPNGPLSATMTNSPLHNHNVRVRQERDTRCSRQRTMQYTAHDAVHSARCSTQRTMQYTAQRCSTQRNDAVHSAT